MDHERWQKLEALFDGAVQLDGIQRNIYLQAACGPDRVLLEEVESLLGWHAGAGSLLRREVGAAAQAAAQGFDTRRSSQFRGTSRFLLGRELGRGGFGIVYEAWDTLEEANVALKILHYGAGGVREFRREFRSLADLSHPNLVQLYELFTEENQSFFTMEVIRGCGLPEYAGEHSADREALIAAVRQLAEGIAFLHAAGKLHRDLKPANVLVTPSGRVVILDFGLVLDVDAGLVPGATAMAGTPAFMAPEQRQGRKLTPASDWYAFGVILSRLGLAVDYGEPFSSLARDLTQSDPEARPGAGEIFRRLGHSHHNVVPVRLRHRWIGRTAELHVLHRAFQRVMAGSAAIVGVEGEAGIGKTALVTHFLDGLTQESLAHVIHGRCHERESVPYKAWDEMADQIVGLIDTIPEFDYQEVPGLSDLCRVLPVFSGRARSTLPAAAVSADEVRGRAFEAFRTVIEQLALCRRLAFFLDDLHHADPDSVALLNALLGSTPPAALWVLTSRQTIPLPISEQICLEGLSREDSCSLAESMAGTPEAAAGIASESAGNPELISELALHARSRRTPIRGVSLRDVVAARLDEVPAELRRMAQVAAVAGHPLEWDLLCEAAAHRPARTAVIAFLSNIHLLRSYAGRNGTVVEVYHDRVRESVTGAMTPAQVAADHLLLARLLESQPEPDRGSVAIHYHEGGQFAKAGLCAAEAASHAESALAFESAARFCRMALESGAFAAEQARPLRLRLASSLASAGHGAESASVYLRLAVEAAHPDSLDLKRRGAQQYLVSGHMELGLKVMGEVLEELGISPFSGRVRALGSLLWQRLRLLLSRPRTKETPAAPAFMLKLDACWSVAQGLALVDLVPASAYHTLHLRLARDCGDQYRIARAMAIEAGLWSIFGTSGQKLFEQAVDRARKAAALVENPHPAALVTLVSGVAALGRGDWRKACCLLEEAESALSGRCSDVAWSLATARLMQCVSLFFLGDLIRLNRRLQVLIQRADLRGDRFEATDLRIRIAHVTCLANGEPEVARAEMEQALGVWPSNVFLTQHWWGFIAGIEIHLYCGDGRAAWQMVEEQWGALRRSLLLCVQYTRVESLHHRALAALACAATPDISSRERRLMIRRAARDAARLQSESAAWSVACGVAVRAAVAALQGSVSEAADLFGHAEKRFTACDMSLYASAARIRHGELIGGPRGSEIARESAEWMRGIGVAHPELFVRVFAGPGIENHTPAVSFNPGMLLR